MRVRVRVPAKINLHLGVGPRRDDGFHELVTVFHAVSLVDDVVVEDADALEVVMPGVDSVAVDSTNIAWQAASLLANHAGIDPRVRISIDKSIPVAGGMAGGSADAAATLLACDALWGLATPRAELVALASALGSDVAFCLSGGTAMGTGRGERITPVMTTGSLHWVVAIADGGLSTAEVYAEYDRLRPRAPAPAQPRELLQALRAGDVQAVGALLSNDLQAAALSRMPALRSTLDAGEQEGALGGIVSGSGPTCVFLARDESHATSIAVGLAASGTCRAVRRVIGPVRPDLPTLDS